VNSSLRSRFIKGTFATGMGTSVQLFLGLLSMMVAVRFVPKVEFGIYTLLYVISGCFSMVSCLFLQNMAVTQFIASSSDYETDRIVNTAIYANVVISIFFIVLIYMGQPLILYAFESNELLKLYIYIPIFFILTSFDDLFGKILQGFQRYREIALSQIISGIIRIILIFVFLPFMQMGLRGLIYASIVAPMASIAYAIFILPCKLKLQINFDLFKKIFWFGFPLGINSAIDFFVRRVDRLVVGSLSGPSGIACYEVAARIPEQSWSFYRSFEAVYFPNIAELHSKKKVLEVENILNVSVRLIAFLTIFAALISTLFQKEIVILLFSKEYSNIAPGFSILMIAMSLGLVGNLLGSSLVAIGQSDKPFKVNLIGGVSTIVGNLLLIPVCGFMGAVYTKILERSITNPLNVMFLRRADIRVKFSGYLKSFGAFGICAIFYWVNKPEAIITKLLIIVLFLVLCMCLSVVRKEELAVFIREFRHIAANLKLVIRQNGKEAI
jgi:O-antigen/teichoic acid export membrane protein